jgi:hypothetical protein
MVFYVRIGGLERDFGHAYSALMAGLKSGGKMYSHRDQYLSMKPDYEQPQFYKDLFKGWGL